MEDNKDHIAISYRDVLLRNGFLEVPPDEQFSFLGGYFKRISASQAIVIDTYTDHWKVSLCNLIVQNEDVLKPLILSKTEFNSMEERNEDVKTISLQNLNEFFSKMSIEFIVM